MKTSSSMSVRDPQALWDDEATATGSLGCQSCVDRAICGGAHKGASFYDCNDYCRCSNKATCDLVCRGNPAQYVERIREVRGFDLNEVPRITDIDLAALPSMIPLIEHKSARRSSLGFPIVALPFYSLLDLDKGVLRYKSRKEVAEKFGIDPRARLVLSGVGRDRKIERYWALSNRPSILAQIGQLDICLATPPNFSVLTDVPRTDNLHAMKRIMIAYSEMAQAGLPTALHVNARTQRDYRRWAEVIAKRGEIKCLAVEFATGAGRGSRLDWHIARLRELATFVDRPLRLIVRGGFRGLELLRLSFDAVTMMDTDAFSKTRCRKRAQFTNSGKLVWRSHPTAPGETLDKLLQHNVATLHSQHIYLERQHADRRLARHLTTVEAIEDGNGKAIQRSQLG